MADAVLRPLTVAGMMSGTSADGIDVAIVRIEYAGEALGLKLLHTYSSPYPSALRTAVMAAMDAPRTSAAELARLHWRLGLEYADAAKRAIGEYGAAVDLIGCHGQTIYHQGAKASYAGRDLACTWQLGEMALVAESTGLPVVSNFRPADMAAGGQGAPLVPYLDYALFRHPTRNRVLQNLGGIGNLTAIPAGADESALLAFDTGPANMVIDALAQKLFGVPYDDGGRIAARGTVSQAIVTGCLEGSYFDLDPPKSAGREQFGEVFASAILTTARNTDMSNEDIVATATALTAATIQHQIARFVLPRITGAPTDFLVAGGGARNAALMHMLTAALGPFGFHVSTLDRFGLPSQSKEAAAFALLAYETWHHRPSNVPAATGATRPVILGQVIFCD